MKEVKIVVGANYGDEGKGLMTNHFCQDAWNRGLNPIVIFHNGTAQRGHTVDFTEAQRHIFHHFGSGTINYNFSIPTYFAETFLIHPMEYARERREIKQDFNILARTYYAPDASVITPFDMIVDRMTEDYIEEKSGNREFGSCCFGSWCATERTPITITELLNSLYTDEIYDYYMNFICDCCTKVLYSRGITEQNAPKKYDYFFKREKQKALRENFRADLRTFAMSASPAFFKDIYNNFDALIFENGQGLGLDQNMGHGIWVTTSNTGIKNPYNLLKDQTDFSAEICYVTRSYLTRHGNGHLEEEVHKKEINVEMIDKTNKPNPYQGTLRYGYIYDKDQKTRVDADFALVAADSRFKKEIAVTHLNEFALEGIETKYYSDNKFRVTERK